MSDILRGLMVLVKLAGWLIGVGLGLFLLYLLIFIAIPFVFLEGLSACYDVYQDHAGKIWIVILTVLLVVIAKCVGKASRE